jgi:hypothetical protein
MNHPLAGREGVPEDTSTGGRGVLPFFWDEELQQLNRQFIRELLTHRNPYTGLRLGEDPAVALFQVVNENGIFFWAANRHVETTDEMGYFARQLRDRYVVWLREEYGNQAGLAKAWGGALGAGESLEQGTVKLLNVGRLSNPAEDAGQRRRQSDQIRFMAGIQNRFFTDVRRLVQQELGFPIPCHGSGWTAAGGDEGPAHRAEVYSNIKGMDFFDTHAYWDHPDGFSAGSHFTNRPQVSNLLDDGAMMPKFVKRRPSGVPWILSEYGCPGPNEHRLEEPMLVAAYSALQDFDGLYQYRTDWFHYPFGRGMFSSAIDKCVQWPAAVAAFVRGYVRRGDLVHRVAYSEEQVFDPNYRGDLPANELAYIGRCEQDYGRRTEAVRKDVASCLSGDTVTSTTGELVWHKTSSALKIDAPKLQGMLGFSDGRKMTCRDVTISAQPGYFSLHVLAADDQPLDRTRRMFLCAVGQVKQLGQGDPQPTGELSRRYKVPSFQLRDFGREPLLMKPVVASLTFEVPIRAAFALNSSGERTGELIVAGDRRSVRIDGTHRTPWFEVVR